MPTPQGFPPLLWAVTVLGILIFFLILRKMSSLKGVVAHGLKTMTGTKHGAIRLPDDAPDSIGPRATRLNVPSVPPRRFSISEDPESDTTSSDVGSGDARNSYESDRRFFPLPPAARRVREFAVRVPNPKPAPKNLGQ